ncbi:MAG: hypothetical protein IPL61_30340 [Myxococcales bacterium]|nr:hypothetical protein [Myxococcales bacterium]
MPSVVAALALAAAGCGPPSAPATPIYRFAPDDADVTAAAPDDRVAADRLLELAVEAKGGRDRLLALRAVHATGTIELARGTTTVAGTFERWLEVPDRQRLDVTVDGHTISVTIDGDEVVQRQDQRVGTIEGAAADALVDSLWRDRDLVLVHALAAGATASAAGTEAVDGTTCDAVTIARGGQPMARLLLDQASHLIVRIVPLGDDVQGHEDAADYREVDGLRFAHRVATVGAGARTDLVVAALDLTTPLPDPGAP